MAQNRAVNLKQLQQTLNRVSMSEFMKLPKGARQAFGELFDGLDEIVPKPKSKRPTVAPGGASQHPEGMTIPPYAPLPGTWERPFDPFASIAPPAPPSPSMPPPSGSPEISSGHGGAPPEQPPAERPSP
jgi:hypothetical protein